MAEISTYIDIDVDLSEFEMDDIIEYLEEAGYVVLKADAQTPNNDVTANQLYQLYRTKSPQLLDALRTYLQNETGRILA